MMDEVIIRTVLLFYATLSLMRESKILLSYVIIVKPTYDQAK